MLTPNNLLSSSELKSLVDKHSPEHLKQYFDNAFKKIENLRKQKLGLTIVCERGNIQYMLDHLGEKKTEQKFKEIYK